MTAMWDMDEGSMGCQSTMHPEAGDAMVATAVQPTSKLRSRAICPTGLDPLVTGRWLAGGVAAARDRIPAHLETLLPPEDGGVASAMRAAVLSPGKRIRPLMMLTLATDLGCRAPALMDMACAIEMVHAASLVLDDLPCMDDAALRRGRPTIDRQFGEDAATLAAVGLLSLAFRTVAQAPGLGPQARSKAVVLLSDAVGLAGLVGGQYQDLREGAVPRSAEAIVTTNHLKTGVLFDAAFGLCAGCGSADDVTRGRLSALASELGQAFQLMDDLHDCAVLSVDAKDVGQDAEKSTLVATLGESETLARLRAHVAEVLRHAHAVGARRLAEQLDAVFKPALDITRCEATIAPAARA